MYGRLNGTNINVTSLNGASNPTSYTITWPNQTGTATVHAAAGSCCLIKFACPAGGGVTLNVTIREFTTLQFPDRICANETKSFTLVDNTGATSFDWQAPAGWSIQGCGNTLLGTPLKTVNITAPSTGSDSFLVQAKRSQASTYISSNVWLGPVTCAPTITWSEGVSCTDHFVELSASAVGATSYWWEISAGTILGGQGTSSIRFRTPDAMQVVTVWAQGQNNCGTATGSRGSYAFQAFDCEPEPRLGNQRISSETSVDSSKASLTTSSIDVYPNPSSDLLHIKLLDVVSNDTDFEISLYDSQGTIQRALTVKQDKLQLDVSGLPSGIYYLSIS